MVFAFSWLAQISKDSDYTFIMVGMLAVGIGLGLMMQTLTIASQNAVSARDIGVATSGATFFRQIGGTLGTAVLFSVLFGKIPEALRDIFARPETTTALTTAMSDPEIANDPKNAAIIELLKNGASDPESVSGALSGDTSFLNGASAVLTDPFVEGFATSAQSVYTVAIVVSVVAFVLSWFVKAEPLRDKSAMQENLEAQAQGH
jgi:hypothetical protein